VVCVDVAHDVGPAGIASAAGVPRKMKTRCSPMLKKLLQAVAPQKAARIIIMNCEDNIYVCLQSKES
jgi:spore maturation protein SpmA